MFDAAGPSCPRDEQAEFEMTVAPAVMEETGGDLNERRSAFYVFAIGTLNFFRREFI